MDSTSAAARFSKRSKVPHALHGNFKNICSSTMLKHPYNPYCASERKGSSRIIEMSLETIKMILKSTTVDVAIANVQKCSPTYMHAASHWSRATKRRRILRTLDCYSQSSRDAGRWDQRKRSRCPLRMYLQILRDRNVGISSRDAN